MEIRDEFCPWNDGVYELEGGESYASCRKTSSEPDLVLSVGDLAAAYLGAVGFTTLARAGRVAERTPGALSVADGMFRHRGWRRGRRIICDIRRWRKSSLPVVGSAAIPERRQYREV